MTDQIEDIFAFYWIEASGISKYRWYQSKSDAMAREAQDDLERGLNGPLHGEGGQRQDDREGRAEQGHRHIGLVGGTPVIP